jgi:hypothetical protein
VKARIDVDKDLQRPICGLGCPSERGGIGGVIDNHHEIHHAVPKPDQPSDCRPRHDGRGDVNTVYAAFGERFRFAELGATYANRASLKLLAANFDALMRFCMRAKLQVSMSGEPSHPIDITIERLKVQNQARCIE